MDVPFQIPLFALNFDEAEAEAAADAVRSGWISMGPRTAALEQQFAQHLGVRHAVAVSSCTAALHIATVMLVKPGDEVIVPSLTFVATVNAVGYAGATPVFADIVGATDYTLDIEDVRNKMTDRTRAVITMHYGGFASCIDALQQLCAEHHILLIEDAAHAPGTIVGGRAVGTFGQVGCFSFFSNKNMTCAEGGMLVTNDDALAERARLLRSHGMTSLSYSRAQGHATSYDVIESGFNYRLDDIRASIALVQLEKLTADIERRARLRQQYVDRLSASPEIILPFQQQTCQSSHYIMPVAIAAGGYQRRDAIRRHLADHGIQTSVHYPAVHRFQRYRQSAPLPRTEHAADHEFTLPLFAGLSERQVDSVCDSVLQAVKEPSPAT